MLIEYWMYIFLICWIPDFEAYPEICLLHINHPFQDPDPILGFSSSSSWPIYGFRTKRVYMGDTVERWQYLEESRQDSIHLYNIIYIYVHIYISKYTKDDLCICMCCLCACEEIWWDIMIFTGHVSCSYYYVDYLNSAASYIEVSSKGCFPTNSLIKIIRSQPSIHQQSAYQKKVELEFP